MGHVLHAAKQLSVTHLHPLGINLGTHHSLFPREMLLPFTRRFSCHPISSLTPLSVIMSNKCHQQMVYSQQVDLTVRESPCCTQAEQIGKHVLESWPLHRDLTLELPSQSLLAGLPHKLTSFVPQTRREKIPCSTYSPAPRVTERRHCPLFH